MRGSPLKDSSLQECPQQALLRGWSVIGTPGQGGPRPSISAGHPRPAPTSPRHPWALLWTRGHQPLLWSRLESVASARARPRGPGPPSGAGSRLCPALLASHSSLPAVYSSSQKTESHRSESPRSAPRSALIHAGGPRWGPTRPLTSGLLYVLTAKGICGLGLRINAQQAWQRVDGRADRSRLGAHTRARGVPLPRPGAALRP